MEVEVLLTEAKVVWWIQVMQWVVLVAFVVNIVSMIWNVWYVRYLRSQVAVIKRQKGWADRDLREMNEARNRVMEHCQALVADARHVGLSAECLVDEIGAVEDVWRARVDPFKRGDRGGNDRVASSFESLNPKEGDRDDDESSRNVGEADRGQPGTESTSVRPNRRSGRR